MSNQKSDKTLPEYDFMEAWELTPEERLELSVQTLREKHQKTQYSGYIFENVSNPTIPPDGVTQEELAKLEAELGVKLPKEYALFLSKWRYLEIDSRINIHGLPYPGSFLVRNPWVSETHLRNNSMLVIGDYWNYSDGDDLLLELGGEEQKVHIYFHDCSSIEEFAPSFSLALWRLTHE